MHGAAPSRRRSLVALAGAGAIATVLGIGLAVATGSASGALASASSSSSGHWTKVADESSRFTVEQSTLVRFGVGTHWIQKTVPAGTAFCTNGYFGHDPAVGTVKSCQAWTDPSTVSWTKVADESSRFTVERSTLVRFGVGTHWIQKTVPAGTAFCTNGYFGHDPAVGTVKSCQAWTNPKPTPTTPTTAAASSTMSAPGSTTATTHPATSIPTTPAPSTSAATTAGPTTTLTKAPPTTAPASGVARPAGNTGNGFFVANGRLYDANGIAFAIRGVDWLHWDEPNLAGIEQAKANTIRYAIDFNQPTATNLKLMNDAIDAGIVPMPGNWSGTCSSDPAVLSSIVDTWVAQAASWKTVNQYMIMNVANEWGPADSTVWRDSYITAIQRLRAAGYTGTISITSGGCGQDPQDLTKYAQAVFDSDPQQNVIFDLHVYGWFANPATASWQTDFDTSMATVGALKLPIVLGEFGPGRNIGPSPTTITPAQVIGAAEKYGFGWLAWAWDDGTGDSWFSMTNFNGTAYDTGNSADLSIFGKDVVENPTYGLKAVAKPATVFGN